MIRSLMCHKTIRESIQNPTRKSHNDNVSPSKTRPRLLYIVQTCTCGTYVSCIRMDAIDLDDLLYTQLHPPSHIDIPTLDKARTRYMFKIRLIWGMYAPYCRILFQQHPWVTQYAAIPKFIMHFLLKTWSLVAWDSQATQGSLFDDDPYLCSLIGDTHNTIFTIIEIFSSSQSQFPQTQVSSQSRHTMQHNRPWLWSSTSSGAKF